MTVSSRGIRFVAGWEGFRSCPYRDAVGVWTIGYGETRGVGANTDCISQDKARDQLRERINRDYLPSVPRLNKLKPQEADALTSFAYNLGTGAVSDPGMSTLARRLKSDAGKTFEQRERIYREELPRWNVAGGRVLEGLTKRRAAEVRLATQGDYSGRP